MKLRMKILSTIMSMSLAIGVMAFAVFAAATQTLTVTNTVNFQSNHVLASIYGIVTEASAFEGSTTDLEYGTVESEVQIPVTVDNSQDEENKFAAWEIGSIQPTDQDVAIVYTITITNMNTERYMFVVFTTSDDSDWAIEAEEFPDADTNITRTISATNDLEPVLLWDGVTPVQVEEGNVMVVTITVKITDPGVSVNPFNNGFTITLTDENYVAPVEP